MTATNTRSTRESIAFRAVIVLALLLATSGGAMIYIGSNNAEFARKTWRVEMDKQNSSEFKDCFNAAIRAKNEDQVMLCYDRHGANIEILRMWQENANNARSMESLGIVLCALAVLLFALFFVLRWIFTGRWKGAEPLEVEGK